MVAQLSGGRLSAAGACAEVTGGAGNCGGASEAGALGDVGLQPRRRCPEDLAAATAASYEMYPSQGVREAGSGTSPFAAPRAQAGQRPRGDPCQDRGLWPASKLRAAISPGLPAPRGDPCQDRGMTSLQTASDPSPAWPAPQRRPPCQDPEAWQASKPREAISPGLPAHQRRPLPGLGSWPAFKLWRPLAQGGLLAEDARVCS